MSTPRSRTRDGCWTCKSRRQKCDGARPVCRNCSHAGRECGGFEVRLRFDVGIASRGKFTGASRPTPDGITPRRKGRRRDLARDRQQVTSVDPPPKSQDDLAMIHDVTRTHEHKMLFEQFLDSGIQILHSAFDSEHGSTLARHLPQLAKESRALYTVCVALQASISNYGRTQALEFLDAALFEFRDELARSAEFLHDATWTAGLLLSSIGIIHGLPWTVHLHGMYRIIRTMGLQPPDADRPGFQSHLMEVMGLMDLPPFSLSRLQPCLGIWRKHCHGTNPHINANRDEVEPMSGLPRSLVDVLSKFGLGATELDFWDWPGAQGSLAQIQLWEAYRLAAIVDLRRHNSSIEADRDGPQSPGSANSPNSDQRRRPHRAVPPNAIIISRLVSCINSVLNSIEAPHESDTLVMNAIQYPAFIAGSELDSLNGRPQWKALIRHCFTHSREPTSLGNQDQLLLGLLERIWDGAEKLPDIYDSLQLQGMELSLL